jgi:glycosyltransferase involved in cell wall biosynthesis
MERSIVLSDIEAHREIVPVACAEYVNNNDPDTVAAAILNLYNQRGSLSNRGRIGRMTIKGHFTWEIQARKFEQYLLDVLKEK